MQAVEGSRKGAAASAHRRCLPMSRNCWPVGCVKKAKPKEIAQTLDGLLNIDQVKSHLQKYRRTAGAGAADRGDATADAPSGGSTRKRAAPGAPARSPPRPCHLHSPPLERVPLLQATRCPHCVLT